MIDNSLDILEIFRPNQQSLIERELSEGNKFAYYTTASTAKKILKNKAVWLRNALIMNDYLEISYGLGLFQKALSTSSGKKFADALNACSPNLYRKAINWCEEWHTNLLVDTYITCFSLHYPSEDDNGRLSMWRAYGNVAIVLNNSTFVNETNALGVWTLRVNYMSQVEYEEQLSRVADSIQNYRELIAQAEESSVKRGVYNLFLDTVIGTKHPGFVEEREYRAYAIPSHHSISEKIVNKIVDINGVPQEVLTLPLMHDPEHGLNRLDIPSILDKIIIGPTVYPIPVAGAFVTLLSEAGMDNAHDKVTVSGIPLRTIR